MSPLMQLKQCKTQPIWHVYMRQIKRSIYMLNGVIYQSQLVCNYRQLHVLDKLDTVNAFILESLSEYAIHVIYVTGTGVAEIIFFMGQSSSKRQ